MGIWAFEQGFSSRGGIMTMPFVIPKLTIPLSSSAPFNTPVNMDSSLSDCRRRLCSDKPRLLIGEWRR